MPTLFSPVFCARIALLAAMLCLSWAARAADLRIGGTGNALGTMRLLGEAFARAHPETKPLILASIGTSGAFKALPKGAIDIGVSSRMPTEEEKQAGLSAIEYARSPTVFAVQNSNRVAGISLSQLEEVYSGKLTTWPDGTRIRPIMRQPGDDNTRQIKQLSPEIEQAVGHAEQQPGLAFAVTDQDAADKMELIPGSLGVSTLALIRSENRRLRPLMLGAVAPSMDNARSGRYPLVKHFYFVLPQEPTRAAQAFVKFVKSPPARKILEQNGHFIP